LLLHSSTFKSEAILVLKTNEAAMLCISQSLTVTIKWRKFYASLVLTII
jgi:hypothetical protein